MFTWVKEMDKIVEALKLSGRVLVIQYEELISNLPTQVQRIAHFLGKKLPQAKLDAMVRGSSYMAFGENRNAGMNTERCLSQIFAPKGGVGDWCHHMTAEKWKEFDAVFEEQLAGCNLADSLRVYQQSDNDTSIQTCTPKNPKAAEPCTMTKDCTKTKEEESYTPTSCDTTTACKEEALAI